MKLISIVMPAYNASKTIAQSIDSIVNQTYSFWELIIINDGSTDNILLAINPYLKDKRIKLIDSEYNLGLSSARNLGIEKSTGSYICFLDSDDLWHETKLEIQINFHERNPLFSISHTNYELFDNSGLIRRPWKLFSEIFIKRSGIMLPQLYYKNPIGILTVMLKKELTKQIGHFDTKLWTFEDQDLWIRIASQSNKFGYISNILAYYRVNPSGMVNNIGKYKKSFKELNSKYKTQITDKKTSRLVSSNYYRYFGTVFHKKNNYKLASLYFIKAICVFGFSFYTFTTCLYLMLNYYKKSTIKATKSKKVGCKNT